MKKNYLLKTKPLQALCSLSLLLGLILLGLANSAPTFAQGTAGNTITFNANNSTMLQANINSTWYSYLRHNQAPIQIIAANPIGPSNVYDIAPLQNINSNGLFSNTSYANNMKFTSTGELEIYNLARQSAGWPGSAYKYVCFSIMAPRGYRFTEYVMDIRGTQASNPVAENGGAIGAKLCRYTYADNSTVNYTIASGEESEKFTSDDSQLFSHTLSNASNILYFRVEFAGTSQYCLHFNKLQLKYVIDTPFEASLPNKDSEIKINTGILNLGQFQNYGSNTNPQYGFDKNNVTDLEDVKIVAENSDAEISVSNGTIHLSEGGTYWIEAPAKFRILNAKVNFQMHEETTQVTWEPTTEIISGGQYKIGDGNGHYLRLVYNSRTGYYNPNNSSEENADIWTIEGDAVNGYTIYSETNKRFLSYQNNYFRGQTQAFVWEYDVESRIFKKTNSNYSPARIFAIKYNNGWTVGRTDRTTDTPGTTLTYYEQVITGNDYTAKLYGVSAAENDFVASADITSSNPSAILETGAINNDGVKFTVSNRATFTVDLTLLPLDPNLQSLEFGYKKLQNGEDAADLVSANATDFKFNAGETIVIPIAPDEVTTNSSHTIIFRQAYNENRTDWYTGTAIGSQKSNYYLIDSEYENYGHDTNNPFDKVDANEAGTEGIEFSNIRKLTPGTDTDGHVYKETDFKKTDANYDEIILTDASTEKKDIYIYTADHPVYMIMTEAGMVTHTHTAYTFYAANIQTRIIEEEPVITVTPIYTSTLKGENVKVSLYNKATGATKSVEKDTQLDEDHTFYGVTVTAKRKDGSTGTVYGYLSSSDITNAIKEELSKSNYKVYADDVMRTILYVDMHSLHSISGSESSWSEIMLGTADNCLFYMPSSFAIGGQVMPGGGIIAGGGTTGGIAVTDITVVDQQPFFAPWQFGTSSHVAHYERKSELGRPLNTNTTLCLPFTVKLSPEGYLKTASDQVDNKVRFYNLTTDLTAPTAPDVVYTIVPEEVKTGEAIALKPYHVTTTEQSETTGYTITVLGAVFPQTPKPTDANYMTTFTNDFSDLLGYGQLNGVAIPKTQEVFYFTKNYFVNSKTLRDGVDNVRVFPYRAYYETSDPGISELNQFGIDFDGSVLTGINGIEESPVAAGVFDLTGRRIATDNLNTLPKGLYIVNGKKIFIK